MFLSLDPYANWDIRVCFFSLFTVVSLSEMQALVLNVLAASWAAFLCPDWSSQCRKQKERFFWTLAGVNLRAKVHFLWKVCCLRQTDPASISSLCMWTRVINTMTKHPGNCSAGLSIWTGFYNKVFNVLTIKILFIILTEDYCFHPKVFCKWETRPLTSTGWINFKYIHVSRRMCSINTWSIAQDCWSHSGRCGNPADKRGLMENTRRVTSADLLQVFFFP